MQQRVHLRGDLRIARRGEIGLGQRHNPAIDAEQLQDLHVLAGLWHHAVVEGHHQKRCIDAACTGEHGVDKPLMPGHVDEAERIGIGVAKIDGDAATLLLGQTVRINTGQCLHQRCLAMIDMAGGANDHRSALDAAMPLVQPERRRQASPPDYECTTVTGRSPAAKCVDTETPPVVVFGAA